MLKWGCLGIYEFLHWQGDLKEGKASEKISLRRWWLISILNRVVLIHKIDKNGKERQSWGTSICKDNELWKIQEQQRARERMALPSKIVAWSFLET